MLSNAEQVGMMDSHPFPIEPLGKVPTALSHKRIRSTSIDSGVNSPHVLSPAMSVAPDYLHRLQPHLMPSTSRLNLSSGPLTLIQQFIHISRKYKNQRAGILKNIFGSLVILSRSLCFALALDEALNLKNSHFVCFLSSFAKVIFTLCNCRLATTLSVFCFIPDQRDQMSKNLPQLHLAGFN